jgi:hypothetical protein
VGASMAVGAAALGLSAHSAQQSAVELRRLERLELERVRLARSAAGTILEDLYLAIEPLAGTQDQVRQLVSAGIDIARTSDDQELTVWLGDAKIKEAVSVMQTTRWTREGTKAQAATCLEAQELVKELRLRDPSHYNASRVAWNAAKVRSIMFFELCDPDASLECVRETQAIIEAFQPDDRDVAGNSDRQAQLSQNVL